MQTRFIFAGLFMALMIGLTICAIDARRHYKTLGKAVARFDLAVIPPIFGNFIIILSQNYLMSLIGYYIYFLGMNLFIYELAKFTEIYCAGAGKAKKMPSWIMWLFILDAIQFALNPFTGHVFSIESVSFQDSVYFSVVPLWGQAIHRILDYGVFLAVLITYTVECIHASRIYRERYWVILAALTVLGLWETYYIFSKIPIDRSMLGFGAFGVLIYYFSIHYRPLRLLDRMLSKIASDGSEAIFIFTPKGRCIWTNKEGCMLVGVQEDNCENAPELLEWLFNTRLRKGSWTEEHITGGGDDIRYYRLENSDMISENGKNTGYYLKVRDVTEATLKVKREMYEATHDSLTDLYTREFLFKSIGNRLKSHPDKDYYLVFANIKNFKIVNDIFGTEFGDNTLKRIADFFRTVLANKCLYGRIGGDNFGILVEKELFDIDKIEERLSGFSIKTDEAEYPIHLQLGVYEIPRGETDVTDMFGRARLALSTIEDNFATHIAFYDDNIRKEILWNQEISAQLKDALDNRDIRPYLQPIADRDGRIVGAEALVRWIHKEHGFLAPFKFIPSLEKNGRISEVDKYMWRCACEILADWKKRGWDLFISVNISPKDFYYMDVPKYVKELVNEYDIDPKNFRVEITETVMMNDTDKMIDILRRFRESGFIVEMDDFGSGYSSLNMLKDMPVDVLKIDMKFLGKSKDEARADTIVKNVINLSLELGMTSLTEGVETLNQYNGLSEMGCILFQGYYFSKPLPVNEFEALVVEKQGT